MGRSTVRVRDVTPNALVAMLIGVAYLLAGVVCSAISMGSGMATSPGHQGSGPGVAHCAAFLAVGACLLAGAVLGRARPANTLVGGTYLAVGLVLLLRGGDSQLLALHHPDAVAHLSTAALLLGFGRTQA